MGMERALDNLAVNLLGARPALRIRISLIEESFVQDKGLPWAFGE